MLKKLAGLGFLALLLCFPLQADHKHRRSHHRGNDHRGSGYVEIHVGTRHGHGSFVRGFRSGPFYREYRDYDRYEKRRFKKFKQQRRRYFKKHRHHHYDGRCPY
jgi:hypothetical protein